MQVSCDWRTMKFKANFKIRKMYKPYLSLVILQARTFIHIDYSRRYNLLLKAVTSTIVCTVIQICNLTASGASKKILAFFVYFIFEKNGFCKRKGGFNGVTIFMWEFYWGTSKSQHFEWGVCRFFVIFNGVIFSC